jgi:hypothetical protein
MHSVPLRVQGHQAPAVVGWATPAGVWDSQWLGVESGPGVSAEAGSCDDVGDGDPNCGEAFLYE